MCLTQVPVPSIECVYCSTVCLLLDRLAAYKAQSQACSHQVYVSVYAGR